MADETKQKPVDTQAQNTEPSTVKKPAARKATARKPAAKKATATPDSEATTVEAAKKPAAKKPAVKKPAVKKAVADVNAPKAEAAKKTAVKKPAAKKTTTTTDEPATPDKKTAAKRAVAPKSATQKAEPAPAKPASRATSTKKNAEPAKTAVLAEAEPIPEIASPTTPKAAAKGGPVKSYEAPEGRKSARGRVAKKVDDAKTTDATSKVITTETPLAKADKVDIKPVEKTKPTPEPAPKKPVEDKKPAVVSAKKSAEIVEKIIEPATKITPAPDKNKVEDKKVEDRKESTPQELLDRGAEWLKELFVRMNLKAKVETREQDTDLLFNVSVARDSTASENLSARALESIQTLLADVLSERGIGRVIVDIDGFLQNRDTELSEIASRLARAARKVNGAITVAGFNDHERRVIHQSLENEKDITTESTDVGAFRKLRISNKK